MDINSNVKDVYVSYMTDIILISEKIHVHYTQVEKCHFNETQL